MIRNLLKITRFMALMPALTLPFNVSAANNYENTWFEIEVILFSQIDDKSQLQEVFPESSNITEPMLALDLLGPYLSSDISSLKNRLPNCPSFVDSSFSEFSLNDFTFQFSDFDEIIDKDVENNFSIFETLELNEKPINEENEEVVSNITINNSIEEAKRIDSQIEDVTQETSQEITLPKQALLQVAIPQEFCKIPEAFFTDYKKEHPNFYYNGPEPSDIPTLISGEEDLTTTASYLLNESSLQLKDITQQLKRSRNFKPLLHMGWRQITKGPKEAIPLKLYAGDNLIKAHNQALTNYNRSVQNALAIQQNTEQLAERNAITEYVSNLNNIKNLNVITDTEVQQNTLEDKITNILKQAKNIQPNLENVLAGLNADPNNLVNPVNSDFITGDTLNSEQQLIEPQKPPQHWTIEGFLKVEVEHFLHVTADFNVINMSLAEQATKQLASEDPIKFKSIRFEQNKRLRSKEIHYFDHPYMGMIIQIRRHEQLAVEEVESSDTSIN